VKYSTKRVFYCTGDALKLVDPEQPERGLFFDGRVTEDFKLSTGNFVSVGPLVQRVIAAGTPYVLDAVVSGINRNDIGVLIFPARRHLPHPRRRGARRRRCPTSWMRRRCAISFSV
jgi:long-subunit acyl-CoA synthetase (AMP-forming)